MIALVQIFNFIVYILAFIGSVFTCYQIFIHFWPEQEYELRYKLTKPLKKWLNNDKDITFTFYKSFNTIKNFDYDIFIKNIKSLFRDYENIIVHEENQNIKVHFTKKEFSFDFIISIDGIQTDYNSYGYSVLVKQKSQIKFRNVNNFLNYSFWMLKEFVELSELIDETKNVEITMSSKDFTFFKRYMELFGGNISSNTFSIKKNSEENIQISLHCKLNIDSVEDIKEIILLNIPNN